MLSRGFLCFSGRTAPTPPSKSLFLILVSFGSIGGREVILKEKPLTQLRIQVFRCAASAAPRKPRFQQGVVGPTRACAYARARARARYPTLLRAIFAVSRAILACVCLVVCCLLGCLVVCLVVCCLLGCLLFGCDCLRLPGAACDCLNMDASARRCTKPRYQKWARNMGTLFDVLGRASTVAVR